MTEIEENKNIEIDNKGEEEKNLPRVLKYLIYLILFIGVLQVAFYFFAKPLLKKGIVSFVHKKSNEIYTIDFNKIKVNLITGNILLTDFELHPDTTIFFTENPNDAKNLYELKLDTFQIKKIRLFPLIKKDNKLSIELLGLINPEFKVYAKNKKGAIQTESKTVTYDAVRKDVFQSVFNLVNAFEVDQIKITNGNFDFLKPGADNPNPFTIGKITFILNNFYADINTFSSDKKTIFSENIEVIIDNYELKLNDNVHVIGADKVYINTSHKVIELYNIHLHSKDISIEELSKKNINIFDVQIKNIVFNNADFKEIYEKNKLHLSNAEVDGLKVGIYKQKVSEKKTFNKDTILDKFDIYPMFNNFLDFIYIDTLAINSGSFKSYENITSVSPKTSIEDFNLEIRDFLIDSTSVSDTNRLLYAKEMEMNFYGFESKMKDSVHTLSINHIVGSTKQKGVTATDITIKPDVNMYLWTITNHKSYNEISIASFDISGFDFNKFSNDNELIVDKFILGETKFKIKSYSDKSDKKKTQPFDELFQSFADKITINEINIPTGYLNYYSSKQDRNTTVEGNFKISFKKFIFDPYRAKITKSVSIQSVDMLFTHIKMNTPDSLYRFTVDTVRYSSYKKEFRFSNLKLTPFESKLRKKLQTTNKSSVAYVQIPQFVISNTNISNALQADSLILGKISLINPKFEIVSYPDIAQKSTKKKQINVIKRQSIANITRTSAETEVTSYSNTLEINPSTYKILEHKKEAIDTLTKISTHAITVLKIKSKDFKADDSTIAIIDKIEKLTLNTISLLADSNLTLAQIDTLTASVESQVENIQKIYTSPKFDKNEIFELIGLFLPKINSDSLFVKNGLLVFSSKMGDKKKTVFKSNFNLQLCKFNFDKDSVETNSRILFSDAFTVQIDNSIFNLKDNIHQIKIKKIEFRSIDSLALVEELKVVPKYIDSSIMAMRINVDNIRTSGLDFDKLYFNHVLAINSIEFDSPDLLFILPSKKSNQIKKDKSPLYFLPKGLDEIFIRSIRNKNGIITIKKPYNNTVIDFISSDFELGLYDFYIDSLTNVSQNKFFIPIDNFDVTLTDFSFLSKDTSQRILAEKLLVSTSNNLIDIEKLSLKSTITDEKSLLDSAKKKKIINFNSDNLSITNLNYEKLRFSKELSFGTIVLNSPIINLYAPEKKEKKPFNIEDIDVFKMISKNFGSISGGSVSINNITAKVTNSGDSTNKVQMFEKISLLFNGLKIDSSTTITSPNLLYSENATIVLKDYSFVSKDKIYEGHFDKISASTQMKKMEISNFYYRPAIPIWSVQDSFMYKTTIFDVAGKNINISGINFLDLLDENFNVRGITGDSLELKVYVDKNYPQPPGIKKHLIESVLDAPIGINVSSILLSNTDVYYEEINPDNQQKAFVFLNDFNIKLFRITNDTARINQKNIYTILKTDGFINDSAKLSLNIFFDLKSRGANSKVQGEIGECNADIFNTYTINGANLRLSKGRFHRIAFDFKIRDTLAIGKMKMEYNDLKAVIISKDTSGRKDLKFLSWLADVVVKNDNPKYGIYPKIGKIAYIHNRIYSDITLWVKAVLSGVISTVAFDPKDTKKIRKIMRKNKGKVKDDK